MDYSFLAIALLVLGLTLLIAEVFVPSGGLLAIMVSICILGSAWSAWAAWWETNRLLWWSYLGGIMLLVPGVLAGALIILPKTAVGKKLLLEAPLLDDVAPHVAETRRLSQYIGKLGRTITMHSPGGLVQIEGERLHSESEGMLIEPDTLIRVVRLEASRLVVRAVSADEAGTPTGGGKQDVAKHEEHSGTVPLRRDPNLVDFDVPADDA